MSSPCTVPRLVRCRVRDLASCFYACRFPLGSNRSQVFDSKRARRGEKTARKLPVIEPAPRSEDKEDSAQSSMPQKNNNSNNGSKGLGPADLEPSFAEEDYIVFCFREDGAIHMISEGKCSSEEDSIFHESNGELAETNTATSNKQVDCGLKSRSEVMVKGDETASDEEVPMLSVKKGDGKGSKDDDDDDDDEDEQPNSSKMDSSFESCDSNVSDTSTSSFAFPELSIEWMGSPVHMPKTSEEPEARNVCLHCCRF